MANDGTTEYNQRPGAGWLGRLDTPAATRLILVLILLIGAYLRLSHLNWDLETHLHPDERFLTMVEDKLKLPANLGQYFDSSTSPLNPYNVKDGSGNMQFPLFVYGDLPMTMVAIGARIANSLNQATHLWNATGSEVPLDLTAYWGVHYVGRAMSGLVDLAGVLLIYLIGRRLYGRRAGLLAAGLLAFAVLPLQQSHFFTSDTFATFFSLVTFYFAVRVAFGGQGAGESLTQRPADRRGTGEGGWLSYIGLGVGLGATVACRINLAPEAGIALLAVGIRLWDEWRFGAAGQRQGDDGERAWLILFVQAALFRLILFVLATAIAFRVLMPYAFGGGSILNLSFAPHWLDNMREIQQMISLNLDYPPGHQWTGRTPFVFPFVNMVVWGLGLPLGLAGWAGWLVGFWQIVRGLTRWIYLPAARRHLLPVAWVGGMFLWQGLQAVQS
ncbi:MAG TPA: glycosyltransferase family 39 protein, partial [Anaerolineae bacterium]